MDDKCFKNNFTGIFDKSDRDIWFFGVVFGKAKMAGNNLDNDSDFVFGLGDIGGHENFTGVDFAGIDFLVEERKP